MCLKSFILIDGIPQYGSVKKNGRVGSAHLTVSPPELGVGGQNRTLGLLPYVAMTNLK